MHATPVTNCRYGRIGICHANNATHRKRARNRRPFYQACIKHVTQGRRARVTGNATTNNSSVSRSNNRARTVSATDKHRATTIHIIRRRITHNTACKTSVHPARIANTSQHAIRLSHDTARNICRYHRRVFVFGIQYKTRFHIMVIGNKAARRISSANKAIANRYISDASTVFHSHTSGRIAPVIFETAICNRKVLCNCARIDAEEHRSRHIESIDGMVIAIKVCAHAASIACIRRHLTCRQKRRVTPHHDIVRQLHLHFLIMEVFEITLHFQEGSQFLRLRNGINQSIAICMGRRHRIALDI